MTLIKTSNRLPKFKRGQRQKIEGRKLIRLAEKVKEILVKEGRSPDDQ